MFTPKSMSSEHISGNITLQPESDSEPSESDSVSPEIKDGRISTSKSDSDQSDLWQSL